MMQSERVFWSPMSATALLTILSDSLGLFPCHMRGLN
jgi:hypothetical protein